MLHLRIKIFLFIIVLSAINASAQKKKQGADVVVQPESPQSKPKLVVGIIVDQMRYDYLHRFREDFSSGGFNRLMREGFLFENANYNYVPTYTAPGHACVYTGATPSVNGIIAND